ncbi:MULTISPECIES: molybdopterin molybdotransferase MoeA [Zobellia]|uniref:Molybdopterin molybdenumtransferase n=1 Tax=Zobellia galactanivorans (strain DSM 12802 / CCUG 47099 / CIP 106680 / NCIMB 13871 / Dsij) TaxID=63186 RepID=G0L7E2_ZOBGA|nr:MULTISPECIES: gephyrin-like molybdotransferase Glp [Zobellia]OWW23252.1 molybdopterin molybdenumtransferase MoeA [Zobellia sp. OII3]CAZ97352.1 Molybdopterin biosynthesis protein [Zobellia galactanivorans]
MIDTTTALELVLRHGTLNTEFFEVDLKDALDYVVAKDVASRIDMPPFRQSAMDGYALHLYDDFTYTVVGEVQAGDNNDPTLRKGEAVRIFTGAPVPTSANTVVMQERVTVDGNKIIIEESPKVNMNIRPKAEQIKAGGVAINKGTTIKGVHIGFLASLGLTKITVSKKPSVAIVVTGNELVAPGMPLSYGEIYESNGAMLTAVLNELGYKNTSVVTIRDDYDTTKNVLRDTLGKHDVVIVTGGVSVGDYDFVGKAFNAIGVHEIFYKVRQKPGKPLFFGKKEGTSIFGLPGNPAAALSCFYIYVYPLLKKYEGADHMNLPIISLPLLSDYTVKGTQAQFLKARIEGAGVTILGGQSSAMVRAFGDANALVCLPVNSMEIRKGQNVKTLLLPTK